jgi:hypothetical protein
MWKGNKKRGRKQMATTIYLSLRAMLGLLGIGSGLAVMFRFFAGKRLNRLLALFLVVALMGIVTGFGFPLDRLLTTHIVGIVSLLVLVVTIPAYCMFSLAWAWRRIFVVGSSTVLYLNVVVLILHSFLKFQPIHAVTATQKGTALLIAQLIVLALFVVSTTLATMKFHPEQPKAV